MADVQPTDSGVTAHRLSTARLYFILLVFLVASGYAVWKSDRFQSLIQGVSQARLSQALGVPVSFDTVNLSVLPPSVLLANVRIGNDPKLHLPEDRPLLTAEEISIGGGLSLVGGTLRLGRIRALRPRLDLVQSSEGVFNLPPGLAGSSGGGLQVRVGSVLIQQGVFQFEGHKAAIDGGFDDFTADVSRLSRNRYRGTLSARRASLQLPRAEPLAMSLATDFLIDPRAGIQFSGMRLSGAFGRIEGSGSIETLRRPNVLFSGSGQIVIDEIERVFHSRLGFSGSATMRATVEVPPAGDFRIEGTLQAASVTRGAFRFEDVVAQIAARPDALVADIQQGGYLGGRATGLLRIANLVGRDQPMTLALEGRGISVERFFADLGLPGTGLSGAADLSVALRWGEAGVERADGGGSLQMQQGPPSSLVKGRYGIPVGGGGPFSIVDGRIRFIGGALRFRESAVDMEGGFQIGQWKPDFDLRIQSQDTSELDHLFSNFTAATGGQPALLGLGGTGQVQGHLSGEWGNPDATLQLALENARYASIAFGSVRGTLEMHDGAFFFRPLRIYDGDSSFSLEGMARYRPIPGHPRFDLSLAARRFPLSRLLEYLDLQYPVDGLVSGAFPIAGTPEELTGGGALQLDEATVWGQKVPQMRGTLRFTPGHLSLEDVSAQVGGGIVRGSGAIGISEKTFEVRGAGDKISLQGIDMAQSLGTDIAGKISFQLSGSGSLDRPDLTVTASLTEASVFGHPVPEGLEPHADVKMRKGVLEGSVQLPDRWSLQARGDVFGTPAKLDVTLEVSDLASMLILSPWDLPVGQNGSLAAHGTVTLPSSPKERPSGDWTITRARLDMADRPAVLATSGDVHASLSKGKLTVQEFTAVGEGTSIRLSGQADLGGAGGLTLAAKGTADASVLSVLTPDIALQGKLVVDARAAGSLKEPTLTGSIRMEKGKYRVSGLGMVLDDLSASVTFHDSRGDVDGHAKYGGGELSVGGGFSVEGLSVKDFRVSLQARHVRLPTFQDFRMVADADLVATGGSSGNAIRGEVVLLRASYSKDFDITLSDLLARSRPAGITVVEPWKQKTALEVHIVSSESLEMRNNVARLTGTVDLVAKGTVADPVLLGQVVLDQGGRLTFRNVRYDIESGTVTFASARGFAPIVDIHARAEVKGYDLSVGFVGTWPRIQASFSSDPPLPDETIFALLLTGTTPTTTTTGTNTDTASSIASVGAGIAAGAVTGGITRDTQRVLRLERFEIDPVFTGGQLTDLRSTIGKQVTPDVLVTYSQSFETTKQPIVQVEWHISDTVILRTERDENGIYLVDIRKRKRF